MNWNLIQSLFEGQSLVFWAAVTAVALGLTLLSVSIVFQLRKLYARSPLRRNRAAKAEATPTPPRITVTDEGYQADHFVPSAPVAAQASVPPAAADPLLESLLTRLKVSADRLNRIHATLDGGDDSGLKPGGAEVDYVYRTERA